MKLSEEQIERASTVNLPHFLMQNGFDLKRVGREYIWKEHDSMHIKDNAPGERGVWHRFSTNEGGDNIAFLRQYMNMSFAEAVEALNGEHYDRTYTPPQRTAHTERRQTAQAQELVLSENDNAKRVFAYLCKTRGLDYDLVKELVKSGAVAQEQKTGNVLFKYTDEHGKIVGAEKVGTSTEQKFKGIATGSASGYGFEVCRGNGSHLLFFESSIDMLSYLQMHKAELTDHRLVSMMGVKPQTVIDTMERYCISPDRVYLCSDNDKAGNEFAERLMSEYPDMKRIVTPDTYKDWNDMLMGIPKKEIEKEQKTEVKKEADRMAVIGNEIWNSATDNRDKAVIGMSVDDFRAIYQKLEDSGLNYRAYRVASGFKMAVNAADVPAIRQLAGKDLEAAASNVPYSPPEKNIIGNAEYRYIPQKEYISADRDLILKMADAMERQGIKYSGRIYPTGKGTLTVSRNDLPRVKAVRDNIIDRRRQIGIGEKGQIIGNRSASSQNRHLYMSTLTPKQYEEVKPFIETNARYSGIIRDGKVMFSVDRDEAQAFHRALDTAKREVGLIHTMQSLGLPMEQMVALSPVMHRLAAEDAQLQLSDFFDKRYDEAQFGEMLSLVNAYLDQPVSERYGEHSKLNDMLEAKSSFDRGIELTDFFSQHDFSDEQRAAVTAMFVGDVTRGQIDSIDETFTAEDIQEYDEILHSALQDSDISDYLEQHKQTVLDRENANRVPTEEEVLFPKADLAKFLAERTPSSDEWEDMAYPMFERGYLEKHKPSDKGAFGYNLSETEFYALAERYHQGDDIRKELALGLLEGSTPSNIEFVFEDGKMSDRTYYYAENLRHSLHLEKTEDGYNCSFGGMERFVSFDEIGQAFIDRIHEEFDDLAFWWVRDDMLEAIPDISDEKIADLITAFDGAALHGWENGDNQTKLNRIKKALYDILGDEVQTEKAFSVIAKNKYNVSFETEKPESSIHFGLLGNGITAYDVSRTDPETNDYPTVAHISAEGVVKIYDESISAEDMERINAQAQSARDKFMTDWGKLSPEQQYERLLDRADISTLVNINREKLSMEQKIEKYMPFVFFGEGDRPEPEQHKGKYQIYQLPSGDEYHGIRFEGMDRLKAEGVQLNHEDYELVYEGEIADFKGNATLEALYAQFNTDHPEDFRGHSLSVSDVVVISVDGKDTAYYCDSMGFTEMPEFFREKELAQEKPDTARVSDLAVGDVIMYDGARREIEEISDDRIKMKDLDAPDYGGILLSTSDVLAYDGWQEDMENKGFEILSKAERTEPVAEAPEAKRVHQLITNAGFDGGIDDKRDYSTLDEAIKAGREYLADDYLGFAVFNKETKIIEHTQGDFPLARAFNAEILKLNGINEPEYKGYVTFTKVGDFYEMYGKNAEIAMEVLGLHNTPKNGSPMVGFPDHIKDEYSKKLGEAGYTVLIEQAFELNPPKRDKEYSLEISTTSDAFDEPYCIAKVDADGEFIDYYEDADGHIQTFNTIVDALYYAEKHDLDVRNDMEEIPENLCHSLQDVVDRYFGTDCSAAETVDGTWRLAVAEGDKVGELFHNSEAVCGIYNRGDKMEIEPYLEFSSFPKMLSDAMLIHNPDKPVEIMDFQRTFETPLDKAKWLINDFCEAEYREGADFDDLHNIGLAFTTLTDDELPIQVTADLIDFNITYEFDGEVYNTEQYESIEDMIENGLTGLDFSDLVSVPDEVIERHTADRTTIYIEASEEDVSELREHLSMNGYDVVWSDDNKSFTADSEQVAYIETILEDRNIVYSLDGTAFDSPEQSVPLMSDASEVKDISSSADDVPSVTLKYKGDSESLDEIKDKALSLGATVIIDNAEGVISIDTYDNHTAELDGLAYELGIMRVDDTPAMETAEIDDDAPLFADADVIEQIQADERADTPFWETPDVQGEQLSLFGDPEPIQQTKPEKPKSEFAKGPFVDGVQVYEALAAEIDRGTGFQNGKLRVQEFFDEQHPTIQQLADFLKKEYGIGGHTGEGNISHVHYDGKGLTFDFENGEKFRHSWYNVASMTDARLKTDSYLSAEQRTAYEQMKADKAEEQTAENPEAHNKVEIGDKFRNKLTGEVCEVVSLEGTLPYYTDDCTIQRDSGGFMVTENISYDKLLNSGLYEYIGKTEQEKSQPEAVKPEPVKADEAHEAEKPEIPTVKNLSQLKKALKPGMMFEITDHLRPECIGERRIVTGVNTVEFTSRKLDENGEPTGKDIYMEFDRAKNWSFDGGELTSHMEDGSVVMSFHFIDSLEREQTIHAEKEPIPLFTGEWAVADNRELFREIVSENERFAKMASEVIGNGKNPIDSVKALVGEFGMERTAFLTALNIVAHPGDGRFYPVDKEWACKVLSPYFEVSPDEVIHRTPEKEQLFERMIDGGTLYSIHNTHLAQFAEALIPEYEKYLGRSRSAEKTAPTLEVGDFIEYKGKEYKVESLDPDGFITLSNPEFSGPVKDRVTFIADEFINSGKYKVIEPKTEPTAETPDKSDNFTITDDSLGEGGAKAKSRANVDAISSNNADSEEHIDLSQHDDLLKNMFAVNPEFFRGLLSDETIDQQEQVIQNAVGNISHEDRMAVLHEMMNGDNTTDAESVLPSEEKSQNFTITDDSLGEGGAKSKFRANVDAIKTLKTLEAENRPATAEEKETLSRYVGWGAIPQAFDKSAEKWSAEYKELSELLTPEEYRQARSTVGDAFYTSPTVIDSIYEALANFGFEGGNVLEPAMGVGNFFGCMSKEMQDSSHLYGVEIDSISGRIAQALYPDADIAIQGFEKNSFQNGCFDVAVGNVPFGELGFKDEKHGTSKLHDYFFAETLDKVKDGGIIAFVTSAGTLDKHDEATRQMLADRADFIGAIRLPGGKNGAFKDNAGTEVTTDIIFLKKHEGKSVAEMSDIPEWVHIGETADGLPINKYFENNPDMVLGTVVEGNKLYGSGTMVVAEDGFDLKSALHEAVSKLSAEISHDKARDVYAKTEQGLAVKIPSDLRNYSFFMQDDAIYFKKNAVSFEQRFDKKNAQFGRYKAFIELRDITRELIQAQELNKPDSVIADLQAKLGKSYDDFYNKYGLIHSKTNKRYFNEDISYNLVAGLEKKIDKDKLVEKSDIFTKRTICPPKAVECVETAMEALTLSVAEKARVDFDYMSKLTGMSEDELKQELVGEIYKIPHTENTYQTASEYLSGDIRAKLREAEEIAEYDADFNINVNALQKAMPEPLKAGDIDVKIGATWLDPKYYDQFMYELLGTPDNNRADKPQSRWFKHSLIQAEYSEHSNSWHIANKKADRSVLVNQKYGSGKMNAYEIFEHLLNLKEPKVYKTIEVPDGLGDVKEKRVIDEDATRIVQKKAKEIKKAFKAWIFKDTERREAIVDKYNELFNSVRPREFDGSSLSFPMMNSGIHLHDHQKNAIAHAMFGGNTLFAHSVGAGKTFEMIATAMESKRLGLCTKSLFAVPNHLTEQIGDDFMKLYPSANILVATKKDFQKANRQQLFAKIATGNYDAVIIGHSQLGMIPMSKERQEMVIQSQIDDILQGIDELKRSEGSKFQIKAMERTRKSLQKQLDRLEKANQDETITFEQLGIDKLFVDEAHEFKNLFTPTKLTNVAGISNSASQKALDLFLKCRYLDEKTDGKGVTFATGTPISNSVTELHTMMRYLEYDFLKDHGLQHFDNWVSVFGEQKTDWELKPAGNGFKERTRIAQYTGMPELMSMFNQVADIRTADTLKLDVPDCDYKVVQVEATPFQVELVQELSDRADAINGGNVDPSIDNMLKITSDGRKLGLDPRLIDPAFEDNPDTKLNRCVENVARIHAETAEDKLTQIIFCDLGVPHKSAEEVKYDEDGEVIFDDSKSAAEREALEEECDFCVYDDIKSKLVARGIPADEIAFIHDAKTEKQKSELFEKVRSGEVRILLGSTAKMGTGTNVQDKLIAVHDLDIPWRPADLDQRAGRIIRQGNQNKNVEIYRYVTKGTFDAYSYQTLENKQKFISQIMTSKEPMRKCEDVDQQALTYSEIKALCTGDERIKEKLMLDNEVKELKTLAAEYDNTVYEMQDKIKAFPMKEEQLTTALSNLQADRKTLKALPIDPETKLPVFKMKIGDVEYTDKKEAAKALEEAALAIKVADTPVKVGEFQGFPLSVTVHSPAMGGGMTATMKGEYTHTAKLISSFAHNLSRIEAGLYNIDRRIDQVKTNLSKLRVDYEEAKKIVSVPFPQQAELESKSERLETLTTALNLAAIEAKKNAPKREQTCYFQRAQLKREAARVAKKKSAPKKTKAQDKKKPGLE